MVIWIACKTAGVDLVTEQQRMLNLLQGLRLDSIVNPTGASVPDTKRAVTSAPTQPVEPQESAMATLMGERP